MRKLSIAVLSAFLALSMPLVLNTAAAASKHEAKPTHSMWVSQRLFNESAGVVIGIIVFNVLTYPINAPPFAIGPLAVAQANSALVSPLAAAIIGSAAAFTVHYIHKMSIDHQVWP